MKNRFTPIFAQCAVVLGTMMLSMAVQQGSGQEVSPPQPGIGPEKIERIVREYLLRDPGVIREALQALEIQEQRAKADRSASLLRGLRKEIYSDPDSPAAGSVSGGVSIVVFFDYNCGYCKSTLPQLQALITNDPNLRIIFKEFPILGAASFNAAKAALAAGRQDKYVAFHNALLAAESTNDEAVKDIAKKLGLDLGRLEADMADPKLDAELERNALLAGTLGINGTPAYIVGDQIIPGAIDAATLSNVIAAHRQKLALAASDKAASEGN